MPSNSAQQTAAAQQGNQAQAEQFLAQQRQLAEGQWSNFFSQNPNPAATWGGIAAPSFAGQPSAIGGGYIGGNGKLQGAFPGWSPSGPSAPILPPPPPQMRTDRGGGSGSGSNGNGKPPKGQQGGGGSSGGSGAVGHREE